VNVFGRIVGVHNQSLDICRIEMKDAGFTMINPDDGMIVRLAHRCVLYDATPPAGNLTHSLRRLMWDQVALHDKLKRAIAVHIHGVSLLASMVVKTAITVP